MDNSKDRHEDLDGILRAAYESTAPPDSWPALRQRIETTLSQPGEHRPGGRGQVVVWRRTALVLAACLVVALGLLVQVMSTGPQGRSLHTTASVGAPALPTPAQIEQLVQAFSQVRALFAGHRPWLMIDSVGNSQIGLTANDDAARPEEKLIVLRLMVQENGDPAGRRYADLVAYPQQQITLEMPTAAGGIITLRLVPTLRNDGGVNIDFVAQGDDGSRMGRIAPVGEQAFTPLGQMYTGLHGWCLGAVAQPVPFSEQG